LQLSSSFSLKPPRHPALDAARGFAVVAMVLGHTLHALLSPTARASLWIQRYWELRGITAPLFLLVSGWVLVAVTDHRPGAARAAYGRRIQRALLLVFLGYLLRWPGWDTVQAMGWSEALGARLFEFDALQCIGLSLLVGATVLALAPGSRSRAVVLGVLAVGIPLASGTVWRFGPFLPIELRQALGSEGSHFPLFPWAGFFFAGALAAQLLRLLRPGWPQGLALAALGAGVMGMTLQFPQDWSPTSPWLIAFRVSEGLLVLAAVSCVPVQLSRRLAPLGRVSLWVYVLHLPVVYGWAGTQGLAERVGPTLESGPALLVGLGLLVICYGLARLGRWLRRLTRPWQPGTTLFRPSFSDSQRI
jgi:acyltransferase